MAAARLLLSKGTVNARRDELVKEAAAAAVAKARALAGRVGSKTGPVIDLSVQQPTTTPLFSDVARPPAAEEVVIEDDKGRAILIQVTVR